MNNTLYENYWSDKMEKLLAKYGKYITLILFSIFFLNQDYSQISRPWIIMLIGCAVYFTFVHVHFILQDFTNLAKRIDKILFYINIAMLLLLIILAISQKIMFFYILFSILLILLLFKLYLDKKQSPEI